MRYDTRYDNLDAPVDDLACSNGDHGLKGKGHNTLRTLITKPDVDVGAVFGVQWNSVGCGKCYRIMYNVKSLYIIAVDTAAEGFNLSKRAFDTLTNGRAEELGSAQIAWEEVEPKFCGFEVGYSFVNVAFRSRLIEITRLEVLDLIDTRL